MQKWEYIELMLQLNSNNVWVWGNTEVSAKEVSTEQRLNEMGREGWELVSSYTQSSLAGTASQTKYFYYIFKRPIE